MGQTVIAVENLTKEYRLGTVGTGTLFRDLQSWAARLRGKPDPNSVVQTSRTGSGHATVSATSTLFRALDDVSFQVSQGEIVGVVGRNGAGKSTLLKILSRVTSPTRGRIALRGRVSSLLEVGTGFHPELTGRENIFLNGSILGMSRSEVRAKFDEIVEFAEMGQFVDTPVKRYSSGMYVRLAFAVAAHLDPDILIVDEVLAVGDAQFQKKCLGKMQNVSQQSGKTILLVSHQMAMISSLCTRALLMQGGKLVADGPVSDIILQYYSSSTSSPAAVDFVSLQHFVGNDYAQLLACRIRKSTGEESSDFQLAEEIILEFHYRILVERPFQTYRPYPSFRVIASSGECVLYTSPANSVLPAPAPGEYVATCTIPGHLLNAGTYSVNPGFADCDRGVNVHFYETSAVSFHVAEQFDRYLDERNGYTGSIPGYVRPALPWRIEGPSAEASRPI